MPTYLIATNAERQDFASAEIKRKVSLTELVETEEEFIKDLQYVIRTYMTPLELMPKNIPKIVKDNKKIVFGHFKNIADFHKK